MRAHPPLSAGKVAVPLPKRTTHTPKRSAVTGAGDGQLPARLACSYARLDDDCEHVGEPLTGD